MTILREAECLNLQCGWPECFHWFLWIFYSDSISVNRVFIFSYITLVDIPWVSLETIQQCPENINLFLFFPIVSAFFGLIWETNCPSPRSHLKQSRLKQSNRLSYRSGSMMSVIANHTGNCSNIFIFNFGRPYRGSTSVLSLPPLNSTVHFFRVSSQEGSSAMPVRWPAGFPFESYISFVDTF